MPTSEEWAYLAGLFDGEGTTEFITRKRVYSLSISNTNMPLLGWCKEVTGVGEIYPVRYNSDNPNWKDSWHWRVANFPNLLLVTEGILPYLKLKVLEVQVLRDFSKKKLEAKIQEPNHMKRLTDNIDLAFEKLMKSVKIPRGRVEENAPSRN